jgi:hypothetical protein
MVMYAYSSKQYLTFCNARDTASKPEPGFPRAPLATAMQPPPGVGGRSWTQEVTAYLILLIAIATIGPLQFGYHLVCGAFIPLLPLLLPCCNLGVTTIALLL